MSNLIIKDLPNHTQLDGNAMRKISGGSIGSIIKIFGAGPALAWAVGSSGMPGQKLIDEYNENKRKENRKRWDDLLNISRGNHPA